MMALPWDILGLLGSVAGNLITDGWITMMLGMWAASLWLLGLVLGFMDAILQPDIALDGPGRDVYMVTFALGVSLAVLLSTVQFGVALIRRDGRSFGRLLLGIGGFWLYLSGGLVYMGAVITASSAITRGLMQALLGVSTWRGFQPWEPFGLQDVTDAIHATVLGIMSFFVIIAAVMFFLIMVVRSAALLVMATTSPIAAAGLVADVGHAWLWRLCRWFHAAAFTPAIVVIVLGVGLRLSAGVAAGLADGVAASIGSAFGSTVLICTASFAPLALFKMLAFLEPGTASGAAARAGWTAVGGLQGLLAGQQAQGGAATSSAASTQAAAGTSQGEAQAQTSNQGRFSNALSGLTGQAAGSAIGGLFGGAVGGPIGRVAGAAVGGALAANQNQNQNQGAGQQQGASQHPVAAAFQTGRNLAATGLGAFAAVGAHGASMGADVTNQSGVGHNGYYPDFSGGPRQHHGQVAHQHNAQQQAQQTNGAQQPPAQPNLPGVQPTTPPMPPPFTSPPPPSSGNNSQQTGTP